MKIIWRYARPSVYACVRCVSKLCSERYDIVVVMNICMAFHENIVTTLMVYFKLIENQ